MEEVSPLRLDPGEVNNDRELMVGFMQRMLDVQKLLAQVEECNIQMKKLADKVIYAKASEANISRAALDEIINLAKDHGAKISRHLSFMSNDIAESEKEYATEPETLVKRTVHHTYAQKYQALLQVSHTLQSEFKNSLNSRVKAQIRVFNADITEDELNEMKEDPDAI